MKKIVLAAACCFVCSYPADVSKREKLRPVALDTNSKRESTSCSPKGVSPRVLSPVLSPRAQALRNAASSDSMLSADQDGIITDLEKDVQAFIKEIEGKDWDGNHAFRRADHLGLRKLRLELDLLAVKERYSKDGSLIESFHKKYDGNFLLFNSPEDSFLSIDQISLLIKERAERYNILLPNPRKDHLRIYQMYGRVAKDFLLSRDVRDSWAQAFAIILSERCAENYNNFLVEFRLGFNVLSMSHLIKLNALISRFREASR